MNENGVYLAFFAEMKLEKEITINYAKNCNNRYHRKIYVQYLFEKPEEIKDMEMVFLIRKTTI